MNRLWILSAIVACSTCAAPARAWSHKEHIELTRIAAQRLIANPQTPVAMKDWLRTACPGLLDPEKEREYFLTARVGAIPRGVDGVAYWATVPDMMAVLSGDKKIEPFGVSERMLHYVDLEQFVREEEKRRYRHDLKNKPFDFDIPPSMKDDPVTKENKWKRAGMLPFRMEQCYTQLVLALREKRLTDKPGQFPRDEHAVKWAGFLAHYVEDNTQPQHATEDYKSRSYFADQRNAPNVHWDFEGRLSDDEEADYLEIRREFWGIFAKMLDEVKDPAESEDLISASIEVSLASYDALPLIGIAAMKAYRQGGTPDKPEGKISDFDAGIFFHVRGKYMGRDMMLMEMKAYQMAWAEKRVERLWQRAWDESNDPWKSRENLEGREYSFTPARIACINVYRNQQPYSNRAVKVDRGCVKLPARKSQESVMKRSHLFALAMGILSLALWSNFAKAEKAEAAKTVTGKSECATCSGVTSAEHQIMLVDKEGTRWVLVGKGDSYSKAHEVRKAGKTMTATLVGEPVTKKDATGKEYKEVQISDIKIG